MQEINCEVGNDSPAITSMTNQQEETVSEASIKQINTETSSKQPEGLFSQFIEKLTALFAAVKVFGVKLYNGMKQFGAYQYNKLVNVLPNAKPQEEVVVGEEAAVAEGKELENVEEQNKESGFWSKLYNKITGLF